MATDPKAPVTIKKYANRRLYDTGTSAYVTLDDLGQMVKSGQDFQVFDAKTGDDITRSVLTQIIFEQESKGAQSLLPVTFLRQLIRFYGDSMQSLVPSYLEFMFDRFASEQQKFRQQFTDVLGSGGIASPLGGSTRHMFENIEEQTRKNMTLFQQALSMFSPFGALGMAAAGTGTTTGTNAAGSSAAGSGHPPMLAGKEEPNRERADIDALKKQIDDLQRKIETIASR